MEIIDMPDYKELLRKYMRLVFDIESTIYLNENMWGDRHIKATITKDELELLREIFRNG